MASTLSSRTVSSSSGGSSSYTRSGSTTVSNSTTVGLGLSKTWDSGTVSANTQSNFDKYNSGYSQSDSVTQAYSNLQSTLASKPGAFTSNYTDQLNSLYSQIVNRDKFSYNMNTDALYKVYKDQYTTQGKTAMQDTIGQTSALTGGYASSYAQTAGQQQYQSYLQQLNNMVPELYQIARDSYDADTELLNNQYEVASDAYSRDYQSYRDRVSDWQADRSYALSAYQNERDFDWDQYTSNRSYWQNEYWNEKKSASTTLSANLSNTYSTSTTSGWSSTVGSNWSSSTSSTYKPSSSSSTGSKVSSLSKTASSAAATKKAATSSYTAPGYYYLTRLNR